MYSTLGIQAAGIIKRLWSVGLQVCLAGLAVEPVAAQRLPTLPATTATVSRESLLMSPAVTIRNQSIAARIYLPDPNKGFYRGTRFDWAGVIGSLTYRGHDFYVPWFRGMSPGTRDVELQEGGALASPASAAPGPVEEFNAGGGALGYAEAAAGGTFVKIGVGVLRRLDDAAYDKLRNYPIVDPGRRTSVTRTGRVQLTHELRDRGSGYAYRYAKQIRLDASEPVMFIEHTLRNTGRKPISTTVYNHNFLNIDGRGTHGGLQLSTRFDMAIDIAPPGGLAVVSGNRFEFTAAPQAAQTYSAHLTGYGPMDADYCFHFVDRDSGVALLIQGDRPVTHILLWSVQPVMAIEPYVQIDVAPGDSVHWSYRYEFQQVSTQASDSAGGCRSQQQWSGMTPAQSLSIASSSPPARQRC